MGIRRMMMKGMIRGRAEKRKSKLMMLMKGRIGRKEGGELNAVRVMMMVRIKIGMIGEQEGKELNKEIGIVVMMKRMIRGARGEMKRKMVVKGWI
uniref:Putative ovule protein n=1 Tax=Solanum chacoense TaxID=4108 RepID=A0A0V0GHI0_SOLCH